MSKKFPDENKSFKARESWLHRWKTYYNICQLNVNDKKLSVDEVEATLYCEELANAIFDHGYCMNQIFNMGETSQN